MTLVGDVVGLPVKLRHPSILFVFFSFTKIYWILTVSLPSLALNVIKKLMSD